MSFISFTKDLAEFESRVRSTEPKVMVSEKGVLSLNTIASKAFVGCVVATIGWEPETRSIVIRGHEKAETAKGAGYDVRFPVPSEKMPKPVQVATIKVPNAIFGKWKTGQGPAYDFKKAGNQSFDVKVDEKTKSAKFSLPAETPTARPKIARKAKDGTKATPDSTVAEAVAA